MRIQTNVWIFDNAYCSLLLIISVLAATGFATALLPIDEDGQLILSPRPSRYVSNQIIAEFQPGLLTLPHGRTDASVAELALRPEVSELLTASGVRSIERVFRSFVPNDTVRVLDNGKEVRIADLSQIYVVDFADGIDVPVMVERFEASPLVVYRSQTKSAESMMNRQTSDLTSNGRLNKIRMRISMRHLLGLRKSEAIRLSLRSSIRGLTGTTPTLAMPSEQAGK